MSDNKQVALVTGASRGIGRAIALTLAQKGFVVIGTATSEAGAQSISEALAAHGGRGAVLNVNEVAAVDALIDSIVKQDGGLQVLVNNAGITKDMLSMRMKDEDWDAVLATNLRSAFVATRAAQRGMMKRRWGRIINVTSVVGLVGNKGQANYAASKAGLVGFTKAAAKELSSRNILVNAVAPGYIQTDMTSQLNEEARTALSSQIPLARLGEPRDIAGAVAFLASDLASYITGQVLVVDGGMVM
jgi:3-oxoacyl-[acyl-carrier protein] reductase